MAEKTLVILKPDAVERNLIGKIIDRYEEVGLAVAAMKMVCPSRKLIDEHYPKDEAWLENIGKNSLKDYEAQGVDPIKSIGTDDPLELGKIVRNWLLDYLTSGPVVALILEGRGAVQKVREITGFTLPTHAKKGTIRADLGDDDAVRANRQSRAVRNLVHASGDAREAKREIGLWFEPHEIISP